MVLDARPPNLAESSETRWIRTLGTLEQFQFIFLHLKEFYHAFVVSEQRARRNVLSLELDYQDVLQLSACSKALRGHKVLASLNTMAMGDLNAVAYGQTSHLAVLLRTRAVELADFICLQGRPPRAGRQIAGLLIDDFILLDPVPRSFALTSAEPRTMRAVIAGYKESGLPKRKQVRAQGRRSGVLGRTTGWSLGTLETEPQKSLLQSARLPSSFCRLSGPRWGCLRLLLEGWFQDCSCGAAF